MTQPAGHTPLLPPGLTLLDEAPCDPDVRALRLGHMLAHTQQLCATEPLPHTAFGLRTHTWANGARLVICTDASLLVAPPTPTGPRWLPLPLTVRAALDAPHLRASLWDATTGTAATTQSLRDALIDPDRCAPLLDTIAHDITLLAPLLDRPLGWGPGAIAPIFEAHCPILPDLEEGQHPLVGALRAYVALWAALAPTHTQSATFTLTLGMPRPGGGWYMPPILSTLPRHSRPHAAPDFRAPNAAFLSAWQRHAPDPRPLSGWSWRTHLHQGVGQDRPTGSAFVIPRTLTIAAPPTPASAHALLGHSQALAAVDPTIPDRIRAALSPPQEP